MLSALWYFKKKMSTQTLPLASNEKNIQFLKRRASRCIVVAVNVLTKRLVRGAGMQMKPKETFEKLFCSNNEHREVQCSNNIFE